MQKQRDTRDKNMLSSDDENLISNTRANSIEKDEPNEVKIKFKALELIDPYNPNPNEAQLLTIVDNKIQIIDGKLEVVDDKLQTIDNKLITLSDKIDDNYLRNTDILKKINSTDNNVENRINDIDTKHKNLVTNTTNCIDKIQKFANDIYASHNNLYKETDILSKQTQAKLLEKTEKIKKIEEVNQRFLVMFDDMTEYIKNVDSKISLFSQKYEDSFKLNNNDYDVLVQMQTQTDMKVDKIQKQSHEAYDISMLTRSDVDEIAQHIDNLNEKNAQFSKDVVLKMKSLSERIDYLEDHLVKLFKNPLSADIAAIKQKIIQLEKKVSESDNRFFIM